MPPYFQNGVWKHGGDPAYKRERRRVLGFWPLGATLKYGGDPASGNAAASATLDKFLALRATKFNILINKTKFKIFTVYISY